ncbi:MAG: hypothetical protein J5714_02365 [Alphaproteobacteria bacterium]|nr:hypothetical protein [Alphaproteobacteria bacterium]
MTEQEILDVIQKILDDNVLYDGRVTMGLPLSQIRDFDEEGFEAIELLSKVMQILLHTDYDIDDDVTLQTVGDIVKYVQNVSKTGPAVLWLAVSNQKRTNSTRKKNKLQRTK